MQVFNDAFDEILSPLQLAEVIESREHLEFFKQPVGCLSSYPQVWHHHALDTVFVLAKCSKHLEIAKRQRIRDPLLGEDWV